MINERYFFYFSLKPYVVTPHLNRLDKTDEGSHHRFYVKNYP